MKKAVLFVAMALTYAVARSAKPSVDNANLTVARISEKAKAAQSAIPAWLDLKTLRVTAATKLSGDAGGDYHSYTHRGIQVTWTDASENTMEYSRTGLQRDDEDDASVQYEESISFLHRKSSPAKWLWRKLLELSASDLSKLAGSVISSQDRKPGAAIPQDVVEEALTHLAGRAGIPYTPYNKNRVYTPNDL